MKKIISILIFLVMICLYSFAFADNTVLYSLPFPVGDNKEYIINILKTPEKIYIINYELDLDQYGSYYTEENGVIYIDLDGEIHKAKESEDKLFYQLVPDGATLALYAVSNYDPSLSSEDGTFKTVSVEEYGPITVPSGVYIAGEDFPAGKYRIELENVKNSGVIVLYKNMEDTTKAFSYLHEYIMNKDKPVVGKMVIEEGYVLDVRSTTIILMPYEGLK